MSGQASLQADAGCIPGHDNIIGNFRGPHPHYRGVTWGGKGHWTQLERTSKQYTSGQLHACITQTEHNSANDNRQILRLASTRPVPLPDNKACSGRMPQIDGLVGKF